MSNKPFQWLGQHLGRGFTPKAFVVRGLILALFFAACHLAGWREHTTFLSGTPASSETNASLSALLGVTYLAAYFGFVLGTPILWIAAAILFLMERFSPRIKVR